MATDKKIRLNLLVDQRHSRVVFAESDKEFLDILLSFLTMPTGTVIRLLGKDSSALGCISNLYKSVEGLDSQLFETEACKSMLLNPLNAARRLCENLAVNIDDTKPRAFFTCSEPHCFYKPTCYYSSVPNVQCSCGKKMSSADEWRKEDINAAGEGVFIKGGHNFIISDELHITPASTGSILSSFEKNGIIDVSVLEERTLDLGRDEILNLLRRTLISKTPLSDLYFENSSTNEGNILNRDSIFELVPKCENEENSVREELKVKLLVTEFMGRLVYMECDDKMVDFLFSFLTLPFGAVIKFLGKNSSIGCFHNLYESIETLSSQENVCIKSELCNTMLLSPKLAPFFAAKMQLLKIEESVPCGGAIKSGYYRYFRKKVTNSSGNVCWTEPVFKELNAKSPNNVTESGGGYTKGPCKFIVTDDLNVALFSPLAAVHIMKDLGVSISNLKEEVVDIGETQALNLLKAALRSETALTKVFSSNKRKHSS